MSQRTWFITGVSSGFGRELTHQLLERGDRVIGTVRETSKIAELIERYPDAFRAEVPDVTDTAAIREVVERSFAQFGRIDVIVSNAGYGLFGAAEELSDKQVNLPAGTPEAKISKSAVAPDRLPTKNVILPFRHKTKILAPSQTPTAKPLPPENIKLCYFAFARKLLDQGLLGAGRCVERVRPGNI
jgi:NAD(P)-dependent dehydrogenase (short-subunit alcohol dehydrogenase family)